ncbi:hypothetical protein N7492_009611 [Penicillium capsulatum]|uniref:Uncharacterized protein n=1 Tax=Penicillium capsulatum TaxID=69766 RepID=A0A9W9LI22_9EURO|nr:hypothetical protein N7492_009611 [Penicillium capsulatum]KAJ6106998.1 hypothetical protein N7512_010515 [Penicillium capsulatum]
MARFQLELGRSSGEHFKQPSAFWDFCWQHFQMMDEGTHSQYVDESTRIDRIPAWFSGIRLNFAGSLLFSRATGDTTDKEDDRIAVTEAREGAAH